MISVLILTKNEAADLPGALASVFWSDDVHVLDSESTDATVAIAQAAGAKVHVRPFDNYAAQRNFGLAFPFKHPWLFILDTDERPTPELAAEMQRVVAEAQRSGDVFVSAYRVLRRDFLFGTWLKHAQLSPYYIRLVRVGRARYTRAINEVLEVLDADGSPALPETIRDLTAPLDHLPFSKGIAHWVAKHNTYSTMEAQLIHAQAGLQNPSWQTALRDRDFHTRRLHQKALFYRMPARPLIKWGYMMFGRRALLDGAAGIAYATLQSFYEYLIVLKTRELELGEKQRNSLH